MGWYKPRFEGTKFLCGCKKAPGALCTGACFVMWCDLHPFQAGAYGFACCFLVGVSTAWVPPVNSPECLPFEGMALAPPPLCSGIALSSLGLFSMALGPSRCSARVAVPLPAGTLSLFAKSFCKGLVQSSCAKGLRRHSVARNWAVVRVGKSREQLLCGF